MTKKQGLEQSFPSVYQTMVRLEFTKIMIDFDGSGDSGSICGMNFSKGDICIGSGPIGRVDEQFFEDLGYQALQETGIDWYNNDGGFGEIEIIRDDDAKSVEVKVHMNVRVVGHESSTHTFS